METTKDDGPTVPTGGGEPQAEFQRRLLECWQGIDTLVLGLAERYDLMVILSALAEHTGTGLLALMQRPTSGALQALHLINRMEGNAFPNGNSEQHHEG
jgi:hypothetical protein